MSNDILDQIEYYHKLAFIFFPELSNWSYDELLRSLLETYFMLFKKDMMLKFLARTSTLSLEQVINRAYLDLFSNSPRCIASNLFRWIYKESGNGWGI